jgi:hypothetical protein
VASDRAYNGDHYQVLMKRFWRIYIEYGKKGVFSTNCFWESWISYSSYNACVIPEGGTKTVFYASRKIGRCVQHLTAYWSGTGCVTLLSLTE